MYFDAVRPVRGAVFRDTLQHMARTVQRDWPESCFGARNCDKLLSNFCAGFWCQFLV